MHTLGLLPINAGGGVDIRRGDKGRGDEGRESEQCLVVDLCDGVGEDGAVVQIGEVQIELS